MVIFTLQHMNTLTRMQLQHSMTAPAMKFTFLCPDFKSFMTDNNPSNRDRVFVTNLQFHVVLAGICSFQANRYEDSPYLDWIPIPPNTSSFGSSQVSQSSQQSRALSQTLLSLPSTSTQAGSAGCWPDPDGVGFNPVLHHSIPPPIFIGHQSGRNLFNDSSGLRKNGVHPLSTIISINDMIGTA